MNPMTELFAGKRRYAPLLVLVFVLTGLVDNYLVTQGYETLATVVFIVGYGHLLDVQVHTDEQPSFVRYGERREGVIIRERPVTRAL